MRKKLKEHSGKVSKFFNGKGFYIALILCLTAIGISCYYLFNSLSSLTASVPDTEPDPVLAEFDAGLSDTGNALETGIGQSEAEAADAPIDAGEAADVSGTAEVIVPVEPNPQPEPEPEPEDSAAAVTETEPLPASNLFVWPCSGFILSEFSDGELVFNRSTGDWRTHDGIDVAASVGTHVLAISSGTVLAVENDTMEGTCVTIDHGSGLISRYTGLQAVPTVAVGDTVFTGDVIGAVGTTSLTETVETPHLHFEMTLNGTPVDPTEYLPQMA